MQGKLRCHGKKAFWIWHLSKFMGAGLLEFRRLKCTEGISCVKIQELLETSGSGLSNGPQGARASGGPPTYLLRSLYHAP